MYTVALTGGIGCGKSTVCELFSEHGVPVVDTDLIARELVEPGMPALQQIKSDFGDEVLTAEGELDRSKLASIVFDNAERKAQLEAILHPLIRQQVELRVSQLDSVYCIVAIPLLFETNQQDQYHHTLVVDCDEQQQLERTLARDQRTAVEIQAIIDAQVNRQQRIRLADDIIDNRATADTLIPQVEALHRKFLKLAESSIE